MNDDTKRPREPLLLFSHQVEQGACVEGIRSRSFAGFRVERVGIGADAGHRTVHLLSNEERPSAVLCLGSAGWLHLHDPPQKLVWAKTIRSESGTTVRPSLGIPGTILDQQNLLEVNLVTVRRPVMDYQRAQRLVSELVVDAVDMESYLVCRACMSRGVPSASIRGLTDLARKNARNEYRANVEKMMRRLGQAIAPVLDYLERAEQQRLAVQTDGP